MFFPLTLNEFRWKIVIHGCIDGHSRFIVFLEASLNNLSKTVLDLFVEAGQKYTLPSRIRCDRGVENVKVAQYMLEQRGTHRGSVITGSSVRNQRIERLWREVGENVTYSYYRKFYQMERMVYWIRIIHLTYSHCIVCFLMI